MIWSTRTLAWRNEEIAADASSSRIPRTNDQDLADLSWPTIVSLMLSACNPILKASSTVSTAFGISSAKLFEVLIAAAASRPVQMPTIRVSTAVGYLLVVSTWFLFHG
jgi:hypothetical protein